MPTKRVAEKITRLVLGADAHAGEEVEVQEHNNRRQSVSWNQEIKDVLRRGDDSQTPKSPQ